MNIELPYSEQAERSTLGAMILSHKSLLLAISSLDAEDFFIPKHKTIFKAISILNLRATPVDITTVAEELSNLNELDSIGGVIYLTELCDTVLTSNIESYVDLLKEKSNLRVLITYLNKTLLEFQTKSIEDVPSFLADFEKKILDITRNRRVGSFVTTKEYIDFLRRKFFEQTRSAVEYTGVKSGFRDLDKITNGWQKGDLIILGARPSVGKTSLALNFAYHAAKDKNTSVAIFSLEMPGEQLVQRMVSFTSRLELEKLRKMNLTEGDDLIRFDKGAKKLEDVNIYVDDTPSARIIDIQAKARKLKSMDNDLSLIIVDYLTLITPATSKRSDNRQIEVAEISRNLKALARELNVPVIVLSQLSRSIEQRANKTPLMSDLRDSGAIEQDADIVLFLHREDMYKDGSSDDEKETSNSVEVELNVAKHRNGALGTVKLIFSKQFTEFNSAFREGN